jgi:hypothetical protein
MKRKHITHVLVACGLFLVSVTACTKSSDDAKDDDDAQIREALVRESIANYPGKCPCPASEDGAGRRCGERSAYQSKGGDRRPLCYPSDVTRKMIEEYREKAN